jgi:hypothetical protein
MKKDKKTIKMVEETFMRKHAKKILIAGAIVTTAGLVYITKKHGIELNIVQNKLAEANGIALRSLYREKSDAEFEIKQLTDYINNLNPDIRVNKIINIPEAEKRIQELYKFIREINIDIDKIKG